MRLPRVDPAGVPNPPSVGKLEKYVLAHADREGVAVGRIRHWISFMMLSGALEQAAASQGGPRFIVKGGVALELRLPARARSTEDLDLVVFPEEGDLLKLLDLALRAPYGDWTFSRRAETRRLGDQAVRVWVQIAYRSQRWATVQVDLTRPDGDSTESERIPGMGLQPFGLEGPMDIACLSLRFHIAQKFHGMTRASRGGGPNDRVRDAVDLLLLRELVPLADLRAVREACLDTFRARAVHDWPPEIRLPAHWSGPYSAMARALGLPEVDLRVAERARQTFLAAIEAA